MLEYDCKVASDGVTMSTVIQTTHYSKIFAGCWYLQSCLISYASITYMYIGCYWCLSAYMYMRMRPSQRQNLCGCACCCMCCLC